MLCGSNRILHQCKNYRFTVPLVRRIVISYFSKLLSIYRTLILWSEGLGKLIVAQLFKRFPAFNEMRMFIDAFTATVLSHMNPAHNITTYFFKKKINIILSSMFRSRSDLPSGFPIKHYIHFSPFP